MMKSIILFIFGAALFLGSCTQKSKQESFEGTIRYKISVIANTDNNDYNTYQKQKYGSTELLTIAKNGSFRRDFFESGQKGIAFSTYDALTNKCFSKWRNMDTIYSYNCLENGLSLLTEKEVPAENVYGQKCKGYFISAMDTKNKQAISMTCFYPENKEYINPSLYKDYNDFFYNKTMNKMQAPFYKLVMDMGKYTVTFEVEKIEQKAIDVNAFKLPEGIPVK